MYVHKAYLSGRMVSSGMLRSLALVGTDVSEEPSASFIRVTLAATSNRRTLRRNTTEDAILHRHHRENLKSYIALTGWTV
jgi:hypothetical protein